MGIKKLPLPIKGSMKWILSIIVMTVGFVSQAGSNYQIRKSVIASGEPATSGNYSVHAAIGQLAIEPSAGGNYEFNPGFYQQNRDLIFTDQFENSN